MIGCTTQERVYEDNANRLLMVHLDDSTEQDKRIMDYQRGRKAGLIDVQQEKQAQQVLQCVQRVLRPMKVVNPYAPLIALPAEVFKPRRTLGLLLSFIEADHVLPPAAASGEGGRGQRQDPCGDDTGGHRGRVRAAQ